MRVLRILLLILFIVTSIVFGIDQYLAYKDKDKNPPVISCNEDVLHLSVKATDENLLSGMKAEDDRDGDVTSTLMIAAKSNFIEEGVIRVDYAASDSHNNIGTYSRRVIYDDYHSPRFSSKKPLILRSDSNYDISFFQAEDVMDGDITSKIKILSESYSTVTSTEYPVEMEVTNSHGDVEKINLVLDLLTSKEYGSPRPELSEYIVYVPVRGEIDPESYVIGIHQGDEFKEFEETRYDIRDIDIENNVDYNMPGQYTIVFTLWHSYSSYSESKMIVIVTEDF